VQRPTKARRPIARPEADDEEDLAEEDENVGVEEVKGKARRRRRRVNLDEDLEEAEEVDTVDANASLRARQRQEELSVRKYTRRMDIREEVAKREVEVYPVQSVASLALKLEVSVRTLSLKLQELDLGLQVSSQSLLNEDIARLLIDEFKFTAVQGVEDIQPQVLANLRRKGMKSEEYLALPLRAPVITVMGHVDHGKTTLLDRLRSENRAAGEAGGITQAIGAFRVDLGVEEGADASTTAPSYATFLDTPGHAAFKSMRAKGASSSCTDLVILVISAVDGLMPQSLEVAQMARANNVPLIIAVNKCDVSGAEPEKVLKQLFVHDIVVESLGGEVLSCNISAKTGDGVQELKEVSGRVKHRECEAGKCDVGSGKR
jgi:translation initiation factor IF-2